MWADASYNNAFEQKTKSKEWRQVDQNLGEMMTLPELLVSFGGVHPDLPTFPMAMEATRNYAEACIEMQGKWYGHGGLSGSADAP